MIISAIFFKLSCGVVFVFLYTCQEPLCLSLLSYLHVLFQFPTPEADPMTREAGEQ